MSREELGRLQSEPVTYKHTETKPATPFDNFIEYLHELDSSEQIEMAAKIISIVENHHKERLCNARSQYEKATDAVQWREQELALFREMINGQSMPIKESKY